MSRKRSSKRHADRSVPRDATQPSGKKRRMPLQWALWAMIVAGVVAIVIAAPWRHRKPPVDIPSQPADADTASGDASGKQKAMQPTAPPTGATAQKSSTAWSEIDDPRKDGWETEAFNEVASKQLGKLVDVLTGDSPFDAAALAKLAAAEFRCGPLVPGNLYTAYEDPLLRVERGDAGDSEAADDHSTSRGAERLAAALRDIVGPLQDATDKHGKFKIVRVEPVGDTVTTRQIFSLSGRTKTGMVEQHATWQIRWAAGQPPTMLSIDVLDFERVVTKHTGGPLFADCTESVLGGNESFKSQMLVGMNHWLQRIENTQDFAFFGTPGLAVGDVNGDGLDDLYVCQEHGLPNRLYVQQPDGTALDVSASAGVDWLDSSRSALLVDLDNDGDQDLVVATLGNLLVAANDGQGHFTIRAMLPTIGDTMSISAADYDLDGDVDLYVCGYNPDRSLEDSQDQVFLSGASEFVFHDANNGGRNSLFRNDLDGDDWRFADVTEAVGMDVKNRRWSFASAWEDIDNDGDQDLYIANDYGRDNLYRNDRSDDGSVHFVEIGDEARIENSAGGMSIDWGDYDRDGWMDAYVSNMWSSAGNRVTTQPDFKPDAPDVKKRLQRFARGNTLLRNVDGGSFDDHSEPAGVEMGRWAWGSLFVDLNNDGWEDVFISNGYMTTEDSGDL